MSNILKVRNEMLPADTDVPADSRKLIAEGLRAALASSYVLYHKTQGFHWNVTGPLFYSVHKLTEAQYEDLADAIDAVAERIRALGAPATMGLKQYVTMSAVDDVDTFPDTGGMVEQLAKDNLTVADQLRETVQLAEGANDVYTADLLTGRIGVHEEAAWMLNAIVAK